MRFERLDILRYGALTDRSLAFRPDARLHIVYGPNEAGKSSALSAISDLLFGFPDRTPYGFHNDAAALRVGARITSRAGAGLDFRRRKGRRSTLLAGSDAEEALPDDALAPFLGTLGRDVFQRAFGLDSTALRAGGQSMLKSGGEIGSLLFSAASGLTGLAEMRKDLDGEADAIFASRRSKDRLFYQVLDAHEEARRAERENELKAADWKKLLAEQERIEAELASIQSERVATKRQLDRLRKLLNLEPLLREIDREREQLKHYAPLGDLPADFATRLSAALDAARENAQSRRAAAGEAARLKEEIAAVHVDDALIAAAPHILAAHAGKGAYSKAREDLPRVQAEVDDFDLRIGQAARRLGLKSVEELQRGQPADADLARLNHLLGEGEELHRAMREIRHRIEEEADALHRLEADGAGLRLVDPKPWADQLVALRPDVNDLAALDTLKIRVTRAEQDVAAAAGRLDPPVRDAAELLSLPLPDVATLVRHRGLIETAEAARAHAAQKVDALRDEARTVAGQLAALEGQGRIVTREEVARSREGRDRALEAAASTPSASAWNEARRAVSDADALSDAALADAERGSRYAQLKLRERELEQAESAAAGTAREGEIAVSDAITEFEDLFYALPVRPSTPERMIEWRRAVESLARLAEARDEVVDQLETLRLKEERLGPVLLELGAAVGMVPATLPLIALYRALEQRVAELAERWNETRSLDRLRRAATENLARLQEREAEMRASVDWWQAQLSRACERAGLPDDATIEMVAAALEVWRAVPGILSERENRIRRVRGMERDIEEFESALRVLASEVAPDLSALSADAAAGMLSDRIATARAAADRRELLATSLERTARETARLEEEAGRIELELAELAKTLAKPATELPATLEELHEMSRVGASLARCRARFEEQADGVAEQDIRAALEGFDRIGAGLEIETLEAEDGQQVERIAELRAAEADALRRRRELETGVSAERAVFRKLAAEEEARELARRWVVLKLAASLLSSSMEAYRERQADPVMNRAGEFFRELTGGRFSRLLQLYDEHDELQLAVERRTGEQVPLPGLSEGTGDQLYLALRLAFLEDYCRRNEPAPLVLDDIFQTFDDERTAAGLRTLAAAGGTHQTLLFTHQMSVVETAERELGGGVDVVRL